MNYYHTALESGKDRIHYRGYMMRKQLEKCALFDLCIQVLSLEIGVTKNLNI